MSKITKSTFHKKGVSVKRNWHLIDLKNELLGRVATKISTLLQGKHKPDYSGFSDLGDYIVAINAKYIKITGNKKNTKEYLSYSGYPGGLKKTSYKVMMSKNPEFIIKNAVSGMLPKNKLRKKRLLRFYIYPEADHDYAKEIAKK